MTGIDSGTCLTLVSVLTVNCFDLVLSPGSIRLSDVIVLCNILLQPTSCDIAPKTW